MSASRLLQRVRPAQEAWLIPGPGVDERLGSVVDRAASLYGATVPTLLCELLEAPGDAVLDVDAASPRVVACVARAIGLSTQALWGHRLLDHPSRLAPGARQAMCPACWVEDRAAGRPLGFRRAWANVLRSVCPHHGIGLELSGPYTRGIEACLSRRSPGIDPDENRACLAAIDAFGITLEGALFFGGSWPEHWAMSPARARATLLAVSLNLGQDEAFPPIGRMIYPSALAGAHVPKHGVLPLRGSPWEAFRALADPALRRAAVWLTAWFACPDWPETWRPGWFGCTPSEALPDLPIRHHRVAESLVRLACGASSAAPKRGAEPRAHRTTSPP